MGLRSLRKEREDMTKTIVAQALEITKLKKFMVTALDERRAYKRRWLELKKEKEDGEQ